MKAAEKDGNRRTCKVLPILLRVQAGCGLPMVVLGGSEDGGITGDTGTVAVCAGGVKWR